MTALATGAAGDLMNVVDISDTTDSANGTNKKITIKDIQETAASADVSFNSASIDGTSTGSVDVLDITDNGTGAGLKVISTGTGTDSNAAVFRNEGNTIATTLHVQRTSSTATVSQAVLKVIKDNSNPTNDTGCLLFLENSSTGGGTNGSNIISDSQSTTAYNMKLTGKYLFNGTISKSGGLGLNITRNLTEAGSQPIALFQESNASNTSGVFKISNSGSGNSIQVNTDDFVVDSSGQVGIGTTAPDTSLHIKGGGTDLLKLEQTNSANEFIRCFNNSGNRTLSIEQDGSSNGLLKIFQSNGTTEVIRLFAGGDCFINGQNLGIGTTAPGAKLEVQQDSAATGLFIDQNGNGIALNIDNAGTNYGLQVDQNGALAAFTNAMYVVNDATAQTTGNGLVRFRDAVAGSSMDILRIDNAGTGALISMNQSQDVKVFDFDGCTDGGTSHTTLATSVKVEMPDGTIGYINLYT